MTDDDKALVERLRARVSNTEIFQVNPPRPAPDHDCRYAADRIEALSAEGEQARMEERAAIIAWLRKEAALALNHDMDLYEGFDQEKLEFSVTVTEDYADAIEQGNHLK